MEEKPWYAEERLLNIDEVADYLNLSRSMVEKLRANDDNFPPAVKLGRSVRWRPDDIRRYVKGRVGS